MTVFGIAVPLSPVRKREGPPAARQEEPRRHPVWGGLVALTVLMVLVAAVAGTAALLAGRVLLAFLGDIA